MEDGPDVQRQWGYHWRSSSWFIVFTISIALFTDTFLFSFLNPILPYVIENRLGLDASYTQTVSSLLLAESAGVSVLISAPLGHYLDKSASRRMCLLWALVITMFSSITIALSTSLFLLFAARFVQAFSTTIIWVAGMSIVGDQVPVHHFGKILAIIAMAISVGTSVGPMLSGVLFQLFGYYTAWSSAFVVIAFDILLRLLMLEPVQEDNETDTTYSERSPLLANQYHGGSPPTTEAGPAPNFYKTIFSKRNFSGGVFCNCVMAILLTAFNATLPLHVREVFHWGSMSAGLMFALLQAPRIIMTPIVGWLKDRMGTRDPTVFGFAVLVPLVWLLGVPGSDSLSWFNTGNRGPVIYAIVVASVGLASTFLNGAGTIEAAVAASELEKEYPGAFGSNGGKSKALSIARTAWSLGTFLGPLLTGFLVQQAGYFTMNCVIAGLCAVSGIIACLCLRSKVTYT